MSDAQPDQPLDDATEPLYSEAKRRLLHPVRVKQGIAALLISIASFGACDWLTSSSGWQTLALLICVLLFHELGHAATMRLTGYRDVQVYLVPFMGAVTLGKARHAEPWRHALVLLAGPLPGIVAGYVLALFVDSLTGLDHLVLMLIIINSLNLVPIGPLDGGRCFHLILFSRHRYAEAAFEVLSAGLLIVAALFFQQFYLLIVALPLLAGLRSRQRIHAAAQRLRTFIHSSDPKELGEPALRAVFHEAQEIAPNERRDTFRRRPTWVASRMETLINQATSRPLSVPASFVVGGLWLGAGLVACMGIYELVSGTSFRKGTDALAAGQADNAIEAFNKCTDHARLGCDCYLGAGQAYELAGQQLDAAARRYNLYLKYCRGADDVAAVQERLWDIEAVLAAPKGLRRGH